MIPEPVSGDRSTSADGKTWTACPGCGRKHLSLIMLPLAAGGMLLDRTEIRIGCPCGVTGPMAHSKAEAVRRWEMMNRRIEAEV